MSASAATFSVIEFYANPANYRDLQGRSLNEILAWDDATFEQDDDYLHVLFPTKQPWKGYPGVESYPDIANTFKADARLHANLSLAHQRLLQFYGFSALGNSAGTIAVERSPGPQRSLSEGSEHYVRITRIIISLRLLGHESEGQAFCAAFRGKREIIRQLGIRNARNAAKALKPSARSEPGKPSLDKSSISYSGVLELANELSKTAKTPIQTRSGYRSALGSWNTETLPLGLDVRPVFGPSIVPSPLAPGGLDTNLSDLIEVIRQRYSDRVAFLWQAIYEECREDDQAKTILAKLGNQDGGGLICLICYLEHVPASTAGEGQKRVLKFKDRPEHPIRLVTLPSTIRPAPLLLAPPHPQNDHNREDPTTWPTFRLHALESLASGVADPFIINPGHDYFRVNGVSVDASMFAGPLPDFAIIEVEDAVAFWWRNRSACDYTPAIPAKPSRKRSRDETAVEDGSLGEPLSPGKRQRLLKSVSDSWVKSKDMSRSINTWKVVLNHGLRRFRAARDAHVNDVRLDETENANVEKSRLHSAQELNDEAVINGIAAFWVPLVRSGIVFGYGTSTLFSDCRDQKGQDEYGFTANGVGSGSFIIPLIFTIDRAKAYEKISAHGKQQHNHNLRPRSREKSGSVSPTQSSSPAGSTRTTPSPTKGTSEDKSSTHQEKSAIGMGHFLLAIATKDPADANRISVSIWDSAPGIVSKELVRGAYEGIVTYTGWLGIDMAGNPRPVAPKFDDGDFISIPTQQGGNTCGIYTILNAWAFMLNIPLHTNRERKRRNKCGNFKDFLEYAREIIDLAMCGFMDSETVQALLNVYGLSVDQDVYDPLPRVRKVEAVELYADTLQNVIEERRALEMVEAVHGTGTVDQAGRDIGANYPLEK